MNWLDTNLSVSYADASVLLCHLSTIDGGASTVLKGAPS